MLIRPTSLAIFTLIGQAVSSFTRTTRAVSATNSPTISPLIKRSTDPFLQDVCHYCSIKSNTTIMTCLNCNGLPLEGNLANIIRNENGRLIQSINGGFSNCSNISLKNYYLSAQCSNTANALTNTSNTWTTIYIGRLLKGILLNEGVFLYPASILNTS